MALSRELDYRLRWMDFDRAGRIQPFALLDLFQDVATVNANEMGIGRDELMKKGLFWAVVRTKIEIVRDIAPSQVVTVRTWPHTLSRFSFLRDFSMRDQAGAELAKATSEWVLMNAEERSFVSVKDHYEGPLDFDEARAFEKKPRKIANFDEGNRPTIEIIPRYSDIDVNGHVNNARYATYVIDALDPESQGAIKTFQIDYRHEVLPGVPLVMHTLVEDGTVRSKGVNEQGEVAFTCLIELAD